MVEHLVCNQAVVGSSPVASTNSLQVREAWGRGNIRATSRAYARRFFENKVNRFKRGKTRRENSG